MTTGDRIKEYRIKNHLTQEKLAELTGVTRQAVTKWENNQSLPSMEKLLILSDIFHVTISDLTQQSKCENQPDMEIIYQRYKEEMQKEKEMRRIQKQKGIYFGLLMTGMHLLIYVIGRFLCCDLKDRTVLSLLFSDDSRYYLPGWLLSSGLYWIGGLISLIPAFFNKKYYSVITTVVFVIGIFIGEWLGPTPDNPYGHTHQGWWIWILLFLCSVITGILAENYYKKHKN